MKRIHENLLAHAWYAGWSAHKLSNVTHWTAFVLIAGLCTSAIVASATSAGTENNEFGLAAAGLAKSQLLPTQRASEETDRIIVKYKIPAGLSIATERANIEKAQQLKFLSEISQIGVIVYQVSENDTANEVVTRMKANHGNKIEYAEVDMKVSPSFVPNDPYYPDMWHHTLIQSATAWDIATGDGVIIADIDTGVNAHPDLSLVPGWNFYDNNSNTIPVNTNTHGTWTSGVAAGMGNNAQGVAGTAFNAKIMPLRVTDASNMGYWSMIASAITHAADNGSRVASISFDSICSQSSGIINAAQYMRSKGGVVVIAGSNSGTQTYDSSTQKNEVTCVPATGSDDVRMSWSTYGPAMDIAAPGNYLWTTTGDSGYAKFWGTSAAAPVVAGVYALIFSANPSLTPTQADNILFSTADDLGTPGWDMYYGYGRVNAARAVALAASTTGGNIPDTQVPSVPQNLTASNLTATQVTLSWGASTDNVGVSGYDLYRNGAKLTTVSGTMYTNTGLVGGTSYTYTVAARDAANNVSAQSAPVSVTTPSAPFTIVSASVGTKTGTTAVVNASMNKPATIVVKYGLSASALTGSTAGSATLATSQSVTLAGLKPKTKYFYQVVATSATGEVATGAVSNFRTGAR